MGSQQFCLKWNNHQSNMLVVFDQLLQNEAFVDVTLACEGLSIKAHKMVLSACSPYFQHLFLENPCKHPIVILNSIRYCDLKAIVDFMYKGEVNVSQEQLSALLKTAEALKVKGLAEVTNQTAAKIPRDVLVPSATPPPTSQQTQRTTSPPPKRKKIRNGTSNSPTHHQKQQPQPPQIETTPTADIVDDLPPPPPKVVLAMSELSQDGPSDQEGHRSGEESDPTTTQIKDPILIPPPVITTMNIPTTSERITSSPEPTDDKSYLRHLTTEMVQSICDGSEPTNKETHLHHLPLTTTTTTTLSSLLTSDTSTHQSHNISMIPSTSGTQNSTHVDWSAASWLKRDVVATTLTAVHAGHLSISEMAEKLKPRRIHKLAFPRLPLKRGPKTLLTEDEEKAVVDYIHSFTGRGTRPRRDEIISYASSILRQKSGLKEEDVSDMAKTKVGIKWWKKFRARHPELRDMRGNIPRERPTLIN